MVKCSICENEIEKNNLINNNFGTSFLGVICKECKNDFKTIKENKGQINIANGGVIKATQTIVNKNENSSSNKR